MRKILAGLALALIALPAAADTAADELVNVFAEACLARFPDEAAIRQYAGGNRLAVMPDAQLHRLLGTDPGEGWLQNTALGQYLLTIEMPPYHTCAIRKDAANAPDFIPALSRTLGAWTARQSGASLKNLPPRTAEVGGMPSQVYLWDLDRGPNQEAESLMAIVTNIPGGPTEIRLVRAIGNR